MADRRLTASPDNVVVVGLGRFGGQVAESLLDLGHEVLGIDSDPRIVQEVYGWVSISLPPNISGPAGHA